MTIGRWTAGAAAAGLLAAALVAVAPGVVTAQGPPAPKVVNGRQLQAELAAAKGKVVLLNLWATWCRPCVEEFPSLVKLHDTYKAKGLTVITLSLDEPADHGKVLPFLKEQKATFPALIARGNPESVVGVVDRGWEGAVPTTYVFDRSGKRVGKPVVGKRHYEEFVKLIEPLL